MSKFLAWLKSKNWTAHSVLAAAIVIAGVIKTDPQVQQILIALFAHHPAVVAQIMALAAVVLKYSHSSSAAGTIANARRIATSSNPPTETAIAAATTQTLAPPPNPQP